MVSFAPNSQYNVAAPDSVPVKIATYQRRRMFDRFVESMGLTPADTILDMGVTSDQTYTSSNYLEAWYPHKHRITAAGIDDAAFLETLFPGVRYVHADGLNQPFGNKAFDVVHSSAVLEHVGGFANQVRFIAECARVARKGFFLTTPNRWFPVEFHTVLPLVHWLPPTVFRALMRRSGREFFADEANLNLMAPADACRALREARVTSRFDTRVETVRLLGWPSNILVIGRAR
jgi:Methyltransferase domain